MRVVAVTVAIAVVVLDPREDETKHVRAVVRKLARKFLQLAAVGPELGDDDDPVDDGAEGLRVPDRQKRRSIDQHNVVVARDLLQHGLDSRILEELVGGGWDRSAGQEVKDALGFRVAVEGIGREVRVVSVAPVQFPARRRRHDYRTKRIVERRLSDDDVGDSVRAAAEEALEDRASEVEVDEGDTTTGPGERYREVRGGRRFPSRGPADVIMIVRAPRSKLTNSRLVRSLRKVSA